MVSGSLPVLTRRLGNGCRLLPGDRAWNISGTSFPSWPLRAEEAPGPALAPGLPSPGSPRGLLCDFLICQTSAGEGEAAGIPSPAERPHLPAPRGNVTSAGESQGLNQAPGLCRQQFCRSRADPNKRKTVALLYQDEVNMCHGFHVTHSVEGEETSEMVQAVCRENSRILKMQANGEGCDGITNKCKPAHPQGHNYHPLGLS